MPFYIPRRDQRADAEEPISDSDHPAGCRSGGVSKAEASHRRGQGSGHEYDLSHSGENAIESRTATAQAAHHGETRRGISPLKQLRTDARAARPYQNTGFAI